MRPSSQERSIIVNDLKKEPKPLAPGLWDILARHNLVRSAECQRNLTRSMSRPTIPQKRAGYWGIPEFIGQLEQGRRRARKSTHPRNYRDQNTLKHDLTRKSNETSSSNECQLNTSPYRSPEDTSRQFPGCSDNGTTNRLVKRDQDKPLCPTNNQTRQWSQGPTCKPRRSAFRGV